MKKIIHTPFAESVRAVASMFVDADPKRDRAVDQGLALLSDIFGKMFPAAYPIGAVAAALDYAAVLTSGRPLHSLDQDARARHLTILQKIPFSADPLWLASLPYKVAYLLQEDSLKRSGARYGIDTPQQSEKARWRSQINRSSEAGEDLDIEAEVIVVGTGAGGAVAAYELASRGIAVALVEAGEYLDRSNFDGKYMDAFQNIYKFYPTLGNGLVTVIAGKSVGGTTTINSGTCFRTPESVLRQWHRTGLKDFTTEEMAPFFSHVERMLGVEEGTDQAIGPLMQYMQKGAGEIGFRDVHKLHRNAPGCDGQGLCNFGCPIGAKRSTDVSFVPAALNAGASLYAGFRVQDLLREGNQVTGITATGKRRDGTLARLTIRAPQVIIAMGTMQTPLFLSQQGIRNPHLGRHLTVHPTGLVGGEFDDVNFQNERAIVQGVGIGDWAAEGIRFEGGTPPLGVYATALRLNGRPFKAAMDNYANTAFMGFMVSDKSEGRILGGIKGHPIVSYWVNKIDLERHVKAMGAGARMMFRAGAKQVNMVTSTQNPIMRSEKDVDQFMKRNWNARDFTMTAYHPLGTARIAVSPENGVCDQDHQVFGVDGLYVMDGSNIPTSLGVNPQITIMAMSARASRKLAGKLTARSAAA